MVITWRFVENVENDVISGFEVEQIISGNNSPDNSNFELTDNSNLNNLYQDWVKNYEEWKTAAGYSSRIKAAEGVKTHSSPEENQKEKATQLLNSKNKVMESFDKCVKELKSWLDENDTQLEQVLQLGSNEIKPVIIIIQAPLEICQLPWPMVFSENCEVICQIVSSTQKESVFPSYTPVPIKSLRILGIFQDDAKADTQTDQDFLQRLFDNHKAFFEALREPTRPKFYHALWNELSCHIFVFVGHSHTLGNKGFININEKHSLSIEEFEYSLKIANLWRGLRLAIFNSCQGLGMAIELAKINVPFVIVFRVEVPVKVAQKFLEAFFEAFTTKGQSLYASMQHARGTIGGMVGEYPCASSLPVLCKNGDFYGGDFDLSWDSFINDQTEPTWRACCQVMLGRSILDRLTKNPLATENPLPTDTTAFGFEMIEINESIRLKSLAASDEPQQEKTQEKFFDYIYSLENNPRVIITGESGSGKSTLLQNLGQFVLERDPKALVIVIPLREVTDANLVTYLNRCLDSAAEIIKLPETGGNRLSDIFNHHKVWLLFDSVDEFPQGGLNPLKDFYSWLDNYTANANGKNEEDLTKLIVAKSKIVITSQQLSWKKAKGIVLEDESFELLPLKDEQIQKIINRCSRNNRNLQGLWEILNKPENLYLKQKSATLLNLLLLCRCYQGDDLFPNITAIYEDFIERHTCSA